VSGNHSSSDFYIYANFVNEINEEQFARCKPNQNGSFQMKTTSCAQGECEFADIPDSLFFFVKNGDMILFDTAYTLNSVESELDKEYIKYKLGIINVN
jgi:hypothetical protein